MRGPCGVLLELEHTPGQDAIWYFDSATGKWTALEGKFNANVGMITANIDRLGDYVLAAPASH